MKKGRGILAVITSAAIIACCVFIFDSKLDISASSSEKSKIKLPIIMYHKLLKNSANDSAFTVRPSTFEEDLKYIQNNGFTTVNIKDLTDFVYDGKPLPEKPIMITFDDGYYNNIYYGLAALQKYNMKAVLSIVGEFTDRASEEGEENPNYSYIKWEALPQIIEDGHFEIQNHSYYLHKHTSSRAGSKKNKSESIEDYRKMLSEDVLELQDKIFNETGYKPRAYTYPFGAICSESKSILKNAGFLATLSCEEKVNEISEGDPESLYCMGRFRRDRDILTEHFFQNILK